MDNQIHILVNFIILYFVKISYNLNLLDIPNNRKIHSEETAYTGGVASLILLTAIIFLIILTRV